MVVVEGAGLVVAAEEVLDVVLSGRKEESSRMNAVSDGDV